MITAFLLLILGLLFIFIEFYLPGGIMAILGGIFILIGIVTFVQESNSLIASIMFVAGTAGAIFLLIKYTMKLIVQTKPGFTIYSQNDQEGFKASAYDTKAIGMTGVVTADLKPAGYIFTDGKKQQAISISGYLPSGTEVIVVGGNEESLIVKAKKEKTL